MLKFLQGKKKKRKKRGKTRMLFYCYLYRKGLCHLGLNIYFKASNMMKTKKNCMWKLAEANSSSLLLTCLR